MENKLVVLNHSQQFEDCRKNGQKLFVKKRFLLSYKANSLKHHRFGWTVPKYVGPAVVRNRLKRYCREFFRNNKLESKKCFDLNVVFLKSSKDDYKKMAYKDFSQVLHPAWESVVKRS